ncbi:MAG: hypothetical protein ISR50_13995 [Alphaproteobacteria bacterium]|nr:hypothetical protein [Alphaproteobacteria bacterium]MBL6953746.1 hypothetical protein [Alphaproteobacteria bacterium]
MRHSEQVLQAKGLLSYLDSGEMTLAETVYRNDVSGYTSPGLFHGAIKSALGNHAAG